MHKIIECPKCGYTKKIIIDTPISRAKPIFSRRPKCDRCGSKATEHLVNLSAPPPEQTQFFGIGSKKRALF